MHIKSIKISGFKSYKEIEVPLSAHHNVFVGRNGSGKSNFFEAIRFVFGDEVEQLRAGENRQSLLHQGLAETNVNASVEIIIDNSDARIPEPEGAEIRLMRMVGLKKDEFFINGKRCTKKDVSTMLDLAGLSSSNPYYVIAQGRVGQITDMTEEQRLNLLKDVAGTRVYDSRRSESVKILQDSETKRESIKVLMDQLDDKLRTLERESAELAEFLEADKKRKAIEYVLYSAEMDKAGEALKELEGDQSEGGPVLSVTRGQLDTVTGEVQRLAKELQGKKADQAVAAAEVAAAKKSLPKLQEKRVKLGERASNLRAAVASDKVGADEAHVEVTRLLAEVEGVRKELAQDEPAFKAAQAALDDARVAAAVAEQHLNALTDKAGRAGRFKSKKDRDAYLTDALGQHRGEMSAASTSLQAQEKEAKLHDDKAKKAEAEAAALDKSAADKLRDASALSATLDALGQARATAATAAQAAKTRLDESDKKTAELTTAVEAADRAVFANMPAALRRGLEEISKLSNPTSPAYIKGIHGPLFELVRPTRDMYNLPVEAVAGPELFNVVVEDEQVAAKVVSYLVANKAGRVTCMPLNRIKPMEQNYPNATDCRPLINFLQFDAKYAPAVKQQFGRVLLCKTGEVASKYAREGGFIGVTLDGDTANQKGALTGGFIDANAARLKNVKAKQDASTALIATKADRATIESDAASAEAKAKAASTQLAEAEDKARKLRDEAGRLSQDAERKRREVQAARSKAENSTRDVVRLREQVTLLKARIDDLEKEKGSEMTKLSPAQQAEIEQSTGHVEDMKRKAAAAAAAYESKRSHRQELTTRLEDNLLKRVQELRKRQTRGADGGTAVDAQDELRQLEEQLKQAVDAEKTATESLAQLQAAMAARDAEIAQLQESFNQANAQMAELSEELRESELKDEKNLEKKRTVLKRKEEAANKLRELGTLPAHELDQYSKVKRKALVEELGKVHEQLRALQHVNKKSQAEYQSFSEQKEELRTRFDELERGDKTIHDLIESLDEKKDDKILTTFKGVQKHFKEIFSELVPKGSAALILKTSDDDDDGEPKGKGKGRNDLRLERFNGVGMQATFTEAPPSAMLNSLSGGQRTLLSLALIFAIQRADPAPFYILDEVDAALDPTHRSAVGAMVRKQTHLENGPQFITSSFGEELLEYGDRWFGVSLANKVSSIESLEQQEAVAFAINARDADAAVEANTSMTASSAKKARLQTPGSAQRVKA